MRKENRRGENHEKNENRRADRAKGGKASPPAFPSFGSRRNSVRHRERKIPFFIRVAVPVRVAAVAIAAPVTGEDVGVKEKIVKIVFQPPGDYGLEIVRETIVEFFRELCFL